jgi:hypothetical protein
MKTQEITKQINELQDELDAMKKAGTDSSVPDSEYMRKLYRLQALCHARLEESGII